MFSYFHSWSWSHRNPCSFRLIDAAITRRKSSVHFQHCLRYASSEKLLGSIIGKIKKNNSLQHLRIVSFILLFLYFLQKQYIFLYRALLDVAQFGNTEIQLKDLNSTVEQLKQRSNDSRDQCKLETEFEVILSLFYCVCD